MKLARHMVRTLACVLAAGSASGQGVQPVAPEVLFERLAPSVWTVETFDAGGQPIAMGSAVVVGQERLVTNCHVLAKAARVWVARQNARHSATLEHPDPERDLCLLKAAGLAAPPVTVGNVHDLKPGSRVYAIGSPRGLEQTISDGLLSGVRRTSGGEFTALQITVPISRGSSGGGLFDAQGRLIGITTFTLRDAQNVNFAVPATWIAEVPQRAATAVAAYRAGVRSSPPLELAAARGQVFEYELQDRLTGATRTVLYRVDRLDGGKLLINQGTRIEEAGGRVVSLTAAIGGEFDVAMPPGGWVSAATKPGSSWKASYQSGVPGSVVSMELEAHAAGESKMRLKDRELRVLLVEFTGFTRRGGSAHNTPSGRYTASAWYAPELGRIVRFEATTRGGLGVNSFFIDEHLQLVDVRTE